MCKRYRHITHYIVAELYNKSLLFVSSKNHLLRQHIKGSGTKLLVTKDFVQLGILGLNNISGHNR